MESCGIQTLQLPVHFWIQIFLVKKKKNKTHNIQLADYMNDQITMTVYRYITQPLPLPV